MIHKESDPYPDVTLAEGKWYKDGFFWMMRGAGNGDVIYNTCSEIIDRHDRSAWAEEAVLYCGDLLLQRKRWPDRMIWEGREAKGWIRYYWSKMWKYFGVIDHHKRRPQKDVTRDPFIAFYCAVQFLGMPELIESVTIPLRLQRPKINKWRKKLIRDRREKWLKRLDYYQSLANVINFQSTYPDKYEN